MLSAQGAHLAVQLFVFPDKNRFDKDNVLLLQDHADLRQAHAELLHIRDHIKAGILGDIVVAVAGGRVLIFGF